MDDWDERTGETAPHVTTPCGERAYLVALGGSNVGSVFPLTETPMLLGRSGRADIVLFDDGISRRHARIYRRDGQFHILDLDSRNGTYCGVDRISDCALEHGDKICVGSRTVLRFTVGDDLDEQFQRKMYESAVHDGLTGVFNRRRFKEQLDSEFARASRHDIPLALLLIDLDHFKRVNDRYGHAAGDQVLIQFSQCVQQLIRADEAFARVGGEEFAVLAIRSNTAAAERAGERIRAAVEALSIRFNGTTIQITASIGVASAPETPANDASTLQAAADSALYQAKRLGRNRVAAFEPSDLDETTNVPM